LEYNQSELKEDVLEAIHATLRILAALTEKRLRESGDAADLGPHREGVGWDRTPATGFKGRSSTARRREKQRAIRKIRLSAASDKITGSGGVGSRISLRFQKSPEIKRVFNLKL